jgi:hypothetical protein
MAQNYVAYGDSAKGIIAKMRRRFRQTPFFPCFNLYICIK